jgi:sporadic carbohydrate cluster 2OG-Fe(II) oxygenase
MNLTFKKNGFEIIASDDLSALNDFQKLIRDISYKLIGEKTNEIVIDDLNSLHKAFKSPEDANLFRIKLTAQLSNQINVGTKIFELFRSKLEPLVGPDVLVQKTPNLVFQPPEYPMPTELHRDAPANSPYEVVVWLPFVDCFNTKSMYVLDREHSQIAAEHIEQNPNDKNGFDEILLEHAVLMEVPFGSALIFWSGLFHGSIVNKEGESRLSMNIRYKNLFSPTGLKDQLRYFNVLQTSQLTELGLDFQYREQFR